MQLVREIEVGMDVDGDAAPDLDPSRIYFLGNSRGGHQGAPLLAVEPSVRAGVLNVPGGSPEPDRLSLSGRDSFGSFFQSRVPSLVNSPGITSVDGLPVSSPYFNENLPLRNGFPFGVTLQDGTGQVIRSPVTNTVAGATEIQQVIENNEWALQPGGLDAYAPYIRRHPLSGVPAKPVIIQFANGDRTAPNASTTALLRAGDLADRATFVRTNLAFGGGNPVPPPFPGNLNLYPHEFMNNAIAPGFAPKVRTIAFKAQHQIASFFASDGTEVIDPDDVPPPAGLPDLDVPIFEVPIVLPLPEATNYSP
jgi:hypothetical protein